MGTPEKVANARNSANPNKSNKSFFSLHREKQKRASPPSLRATQERGSLPNGHTKKFANAKKSYKLKQIKHFLEHRKTRKARKVFSFL